MQGLPFLHSISKSYHLGLIFNEQGPTKKYPSPERLTAYYESRI